MERLIRKMGDNQAAKQSLGMSMWLKKVETKQQAQPSLEEHAPSKESRTEMQPPAKPAERHASSVIDSAASPICKPAAGVLGMVSPPSQTGEPIGSQECTSEIPAVQVDAAEDGVQSALEDRGAACTLSTAKHNSQSAGTIEGKKDKSETEWGQSEDPFKPPDFRRYIEDVAGEDKDEDEEEDEVGKKTRWGGTDDEESSVAGAEEDDDELPDVNAVANEGSADENGEEQEVQKTEKKNVRAQDFDDEEEFFLAGGDVKEAKTRKDWVWHDIVEDMDLLLEPEYDKEKKTAKEAKEAARKLQKDTERLLRERRCIIPPAYVERRTMLSFSEKLLAKSAQRAKARAAALQGTIEERPMAPPTAPHDLEAADDHPAGMGDDDEDVEDDIVILVKHTPKSTDDTVPAKVASKQPFQAIMKDSSTTAPAASVSKPQAPATAHKLPFKIEAANPRHLLRARLLKTALERSEHVEPLAEKDDDKDQSIRVSGDVQDIIQNGGTMRTLPGRDIPTPMAESQELFDPKISSMHGDETGEQFAGDLQTLVLQYNDDNTQAAFGGQESCAPDASNLRTVPASQSNGCVAETLSRAKSEEMATTALFGADEIIHETKTCAPRKYGLKANAVAAEVRKSVVVIDEDESGYENDDQVWSDHNSGEESEDEEEVLLSVKVEEMRAAALLKEQEPADDDDDDEDEDDEDDDDDDDDEEEEEEPAVPVKKSLADIQSIKKQSNMRLGTLEAGYLRNEDKVVGYHDDAEEAEEDRGEGIDLMDTDGEDNEEEQEEGSDAERQVAEGFIEDAKYAGEDRDPSLMRDAQMRIDDEDDQMVTDRIMDVIQGNARRKRALANEQDGWVPNAKARKRTFNGDGEEVDDSQEQSVGIGLLDDDQLEDAAAQMSAEAARQRVERLKFIQQKRAQEAMNEPDDDEQELPAHNPLTRKVSTCAPLSAFVRSLSNVGRSVSGGMMCGRELKRTITPGQRPFGRGGSLLGSQVKVTGGDGMNGNAQIGSSKSFFFDTKNRGSEAADADRDAADQNAAPASELSMIKRSKSFAPMPLQRRKTNCKPLVRTTSNLLTTLGGL